MKKEHFPDKYLTTVNTFNNVAKQYLDYFKDFKTYQPSYDWLLASMDEQHQRLLDVACGPGQVGHYLLQRNHQLKLHGVDMAPNMIELAQELNPTANYQVMDCRRVAELKHTFDVIVCGFCLPYLSLTDSKRLIKDMSDMLAPNGILYLSTTSSNEADGYRSSKASKGQVFVHQHDISEILAMIQNAGLTVFKHEQIIHWHNDKETVDEFILAKKH